VKDRRNFRYWRLGDRVGRCSAVTAIGTSLVCLRALSAPSPPPLRGRPFPPSRRTRPPATAGRSRSVSRNCRQSPKCPFSRRMMTKPLQRNDILDYRISEGLCDGRRSWQTRSTGPRMARLPDLMVSRAFVPPCARQRAAIGWYLSDQPSPGTGIGTLDACPIAMQHACQPPMRAGTPADEAREQALS
jgi:hypothetical protein